MKRLCSMLMVNLEGGNMILRILTDNNYLDVELKEQIDTAIDNSSTIMVDTKQDTTFFINTINVVAIEIINTPPINNK